MHDAKPVLMLLVLCACALGWLGLHWFGLSPKIREQRVREIAHLEEARTLPPPRFMDQARWLLLHRLARLQGLSLLFGLSALMGLAEGVVYQQRDPGAGMGLRNWTLGLMSMALILGVVGGLFLLPVPWSVSVVAGSGTLWSGLTAFLLSTGRPHVA